MAKMRPGSAKDQLKRRALSILKRKKAYEAQREQLVQQGFNLDQAAYVNSSLQDTATTMAAMKAASSSMKTELMDQHYEIQEAMSRAYETPDGYDEADLEAELD